MLFNSLPFLIFLPIVFTIYWLIPRRRVKSQNVLLILAGCIFYGSWDWRFLGLLFVSAIVDFAAGLILEKERRPARRRGVLFASMATNLGILGTFKYFNFFASSFAELAGHLGWSPGFSTLNIVLPVGLSFYTFQSMAYTIDVYRGTIPAERDARAYFAFVCFFPQMVAGPIQRAGDFLPQFKRQHWLDLDEVRRGGEQILWGLFKKVVIADNLAGPVEHCFSSAATLNSPSLLCGAFLFAVQIYCDFSGYSDIAIGCARLLGFHLKRNFAYPYFSRSIIEFWQRWHISLSTWFRDYLYIPLGGNRVTKPRWIGNLVVTFAVSGLWHGANWTFVAWGLFHGLLYSGYFLLFGRRRTEERRLPRLWQFGSMVVTFAVVMVSWVFFRAASIRDAFAYLGGMTDRWFVREYLTFVPLDGVTLAAGILIVEWLRRSKEFSLDLSGHGRIVRWTLYYGVIAALLLKGNFNYVPFIYFNF